MKAKNQALTLIELLIASSIFTVVMLSIYLTFNTGVFGYRDINQNLDIYQAARVSLERFNLDLRNCFAYSSADTKFYGTSQGLGFLTLVNVMNDGEAMPNYASVSYSLEGGNLLRLLRKNQDALNQKSETEAQELASDVNALILSYGFMESAGDELKWKDAWEDKAALPLAVKIKLVMGAKAGQEFVRTVYLP